MDNKESTESREPYLRKIEQFLELRDILIELGVMKASYH